MVTDSREMTKLICVHCGPCHTSDDPTCPKYIKEKEVVAISFEENIPYEAARNKVVQGETSYSSKLKLRNSSQTDNTNIDQTSTTGTGATLIIETKDASTGRTDENICMENHIKQTLETLEEDLPTTDRIIYGRKPKTLPAWMVIVTELTRALTTATDLEDFRINFASIIQDIENEINTNSVSTPTQGPHSDTSEIEADNITTTPTLQEPRSEYRTLV